MVLAGAACTAQSNREFDIRLREMAGSNERHLLASMGRIPDSTDQLDPDTRILQWRWDTSYISPGLPPSYVAGGRDGPWIALRGIPPTLVRQDCIVEWTVTGGIARSYRWHGRGCGSVRFARSPAPD
jgi:hypothetical protein